MAIIKRYGTQGNDLITLTNQGSPDTVIQTFALAGNDTIDGAHYRDNIIYGGQGNDLILGGSGRDRLHGDDGDDTIEAGNGGSWLTGGAGDDWLGSSGGSDYLDGGIGNDNFHLGTGWDTVVGGDGVDTIRLHATMDFRLDLSRIGPQQVGNGLKIISGVENASLHHGDHRVIGSNLANSLRTWTGDDTVSGLGGNDVLDTFEGDDILNGGTGNDLLIAGSGNDRLIGGEGADTLSGGLNADVFVFAANAGQDVIRAFEIGQDIIEIASGAESFADLAITDQGDHALVSFGAVQIQLRNVDHAALDASDFLFV